MNSAYLIVAVFRNSDKTLTAPSIWLGAVGETPSDIYHHWQENLSNFNKGEEPIVSHVLEVNPLNNHVSILPWADVEKMTSELYYKIKT